jgi:hypothetical protein
VAIVPHDAPRCQHSDASAAPRRTVGKIYNRRRKARPRGVNQLNLIIKKVWHESCETCGERQRDTIGVIATRRKGE